MNNEPKAEPKAEGDGLEDAAKSFLLQNFKRKNLTYEQAMASFARQQRREAVAEFIERVDKGWCADEPVVELLKSVAKEME